MYSSWILSGSDIHIQIPLTCYVGLILCSTAVATASHSTVAGIMRVLWSYCDKRLRSYYTCNSVRVPSTVLRLVVEQYFVIWDPRSQSEESGCVHVKGLWGCAAQMGWFSREIFRHGSKHGFVFLFKNLQDFGVGMQTWENLYISKAKSFKMGTYFSCQNDP